MDSYRQITVTRQQDVNCVRLKRFRLDETDIQQAADEILTLCAEPECKLALSVGPEPPFLLYSVFLAKLVTIRNALLKTGGRLVLCEVGPITYSVFEASKLTEHFTFATDFAAAIALFQQAKS